MQSLTGTKSAKVAGDIGRVSLWKFSYCILPIIIDVFHVFFYTLGALEYPLNTLYTMLSLESTSSSGTKFIKDLALAVAAVPVAWPVICFTITEKSILLWIQYSYWLTFECLSNMKDYVDFIVNHDLPNGLTRAESAVQVKVNRLRSSILAVDHLSVLQQRYLSVRIFYFLLDVATIQMERVISLVDSDLNRFGSHRKLGLALAAMSITVEPLVLIMALRRISLCCRKVTEISKIMEENAVTISNRRLTDVMERVQLLKLHPSAMGFYRVDLRILVGMAGSIITYTVIIIQFLQPK